MNDSDLLRKYVSYNPTTGEFRWKVWSKKLTPGGIAGTIKEEGKRRKKYRIINLHNKSFRAARVAYLLMNGYWPPEGYEMDHRDGDGTNDKWENLRLLTVAENRAYKTARYGNIDDWEIFSSTWTVFR